MPQNPQSRAPGDDLDALAREVWTLMSELVLANERRRAAADALGMSFARVRAVRRIARQPMTMREIATVLDVDPPNATPVVDDLEALGLVRRRPHPTDRRVKLVEATRLGKQAARKADDILYAPPPGLTALKRSDLSTLHALLRQVATS